MKIRIENLIGDTLENLNLFISKKEKKGINFDDFKKYLKNTNFNKFVFILGGKQISGSLSPFIHNYGQFLLNENDKTDKSFYILCNLEKYNLTTEEVLDFIGKNENILGANVTMPYKEEVFSILQKEKTLEKIAIEAGAVNTIFKKNGKIFGTNTDVFGIELPISSVILGLDPGIQLLEKWNDFLLDSRLRGNDKEKSENNKEKIDNKTAYIFGAGGACRGVIVALKKLGFSKIIIFNRSLENAKKIKNDFEAKNFKIEIIEYDLMNLEKSSIKNNFAEKGILINTLPFGFKENFPKLLVLENEFEEIFSKISLFFDIVYDLEKGKTPTIKKIIENFPKIKICDGIDMILNQAVGGFEKWFGENLDIKKIEGVIRK